MPQIIPIKDLKDTARISTMCSETNEPIYITKNGYGSMVIMDVNAYEEKMAMLDVYTKLALAEDEIREGNVLDADESLRALRRKYNV
ncbi:MAG: type II toxin-antitoxin system Phd/YefM family antitoxin [Eubacteriales bacterium]